MAAGPLQAAFQKLNRDDPAVPAMTSPQNGRVHRYRACRTPARRGGSLPLPVPGLRGRRANRATPNRRARTVREPCGPARRAPRGDAGRHPRARPRPGLRYTRRLSGCPHPGGRTQGPDRPFARRDGGVGMCAAGDTPAPPFQASLRPPSRGQSSPAELTQPGARPGRDAPGAPAPVFWGGGRHRRLPRAGSAAPRHRRCSTMLRAAPGGACGLTPTVTGTQTRLSALFSSFLPFFPPLISLPPPAARQALQKHPAPTPPRRPTRQRRRSPTRAGPTAPRPDTRRGAGERRDQRSPPSPRACRGRAALTCRRRWLPVSLRSLAHPLAHTAQGTACRRAAPLNSPAARAPARALSGSFPRQSQPQPPRSRPPAGPQLAEKAGGMV
ncbi:basic proline-rich protein-like [Falco rusticolus]|uniref:basic proline-rich protein-like n=1 Tax=Falco rusticolus TaxID=120794 RepID=UPI00188698A9|nr:basic proline-rich protein-like [Falco rusticolus]